jgi:hypothetical protein
MKKPGDEPGFCWIYFSRHVKDFLVEKWAEGALDAG